MTNEGICKSDELITLPLETTKAELIKEICRLLTISKPFNLTITTKDQTKSYGIVTISIFTDDIDFLLYGAYDNPISYRKETDCFAVTNSQVNNARLLEMIFAGLDDDLIVQYDTLSEEEENDICMAY